MKRIYASIVFSFLLLALSSCGEDYPEGTKEFGIFTVSSDDELIVIMDGEIGDNTFEALSTLLDRFPDVQEIVMKEVPGSSNDEVNLQASLLVHQNEIETHLEDDGLIASGGVDFFLAGANRRIGQGSMIGVHSWSDGTNEATDFPVGDENHKPYIEYYKNIGFSQQEAEEFYYFTINAAPANEIHYMSEAEIDQYKITTQ